MLGGGWRGGEGGARIKLRDSQFREHVGGKSSNSYNIIIQMKYGIGEHINFGGIVNC